MAKAEDEELARSLPVPEVVEEPPFDLESGGGGRSGPYLYSSGYESILRMYRCNLI